jgi:hypothetical protein
MAENLRLTSAGVLVGGRREQTEAEVKQASKPCRLYSRYRGTKECSTAAVITSSFQATTRTSVVC